jgi:hypothetical protein
MSHSAQFKIHPSNLHSRAPPTRTAVVSPRSEVGSARSAVGRASPLLMHDPWGHRPAPPLRRYDGHDGIGSTTTTTARGPSPSPSPMPSPSPPPQRAAVPGRGVWSTTTRTQNGARLTFRVDAHADARTRSAVARPSNVMYPRRGLRMWFFVHLTSVESLFSTTLLPGAALPLPALLRAVVLADGSLKANFRARPGS